MILPLVDLALRFKQLLPYHSQSAHFKLIAVTET